MSLKIEFYKSICNGHLESFKDLLKIFKNLNFLFDSGESLLHIATIYRQYSISKFLVENGANVNILNKAHNTPITYSIRHNDLKITQLLIEYGADIDLINHNDIFNIFKKNNLKYIDLFLSKKTYLDHNFLNSVVNYLSLDSLKIFQSYNLNLFETDFNGNSLLHQLSSSPFDSSNNLDCISYLISQNIDINLQNKHFATPLTLSVFNHNLLIFSHLLSLGADPNIQNSFGDNILHIICKHDLIKFIPILFQYDINLNIKNLLNQTPLDIAYEQKIYELVDMINSYKNYKDLITLEHSPIKDTINKNIKQKL